MFIERRFKNLFLIYTFAIFLIPFLIFRNQRAFVPFHVFGTNIEFNTFEFFFSTVEVIIGLNKTLFQRAEETKIALTIRKSTGNLHAIDKQISTSKILLQKTEWTIFVEFSFLYIMAVKMELIS